MKENKYYTTLNFCLPFAYVMILGFFFTENTDKVNMLHRDQTDEWKGWMQLVILIYHLTGASKVLPLYMHIRVLVSSYLFLTGFGHFCYYWDKGEFGFIRYCV
ncbi:CAS1 domain-containing protein 1, partial [Biomphalaria pfeifferi]